MDPSETLREENRRLRRAMRDLVALSTLPAVWVGLGPDGIARSLADVLLNTLSLDFVYVRLAGGASEGLIEVVRSRYTPDHIAPLRSALAPWLRADQTEPPATLPDPFGGGVSKASRPLVRIPFASTEILATSATYSESPAVDFVGRIAEKWPLKN